jgi:nuclear pore complex protein Nup54
MQQQQLQQLLLAVSQPSVFGDERDALVAKWNALQALWGTGRGYLSQAGQYVDFTRTNPFCAFKAVGYSCVPKFRTEDGLLGLVFAKKLSDFEQQQVALVDALTKMINRPTLSVCVESVNAVTAEKYVTSLLE